MYSSYSKIILCVIAMSTCTIVNAFTLTNLRTASSSTQLHIFGDALKGAFSNDESLGKAKNAGLSNGPNENENVTINGKKVKAIVGQPVSRVAAAARVKISYSCKKGDCGTCNVKINGRVAKACQSNIPSGKCDIRTL